MRHAIIALAVAFSAGTQLVAQELGISEFTTIAPHHTQEMEVTVMFPATGGDKVMFAENPVFYGTPVLENAELVSG